MATKFSPCKGSYVLNQFPSNVMFGMNGFHVSASGAIQGHHGLLVFYFITDRNHHLAILNLLSANAFNLVKPKSFLFGKLLRLGCKCFSLAPLASTLYQMTKLLTRPN